MFFGLKRKINKQVKDKTMPANGVICSACGGSGEVHNENHYYADCDYGFRYVTCSSCYGRGYVRIKQ